MSGSKILFEIIAGGVFWLLMGTDYYWDSSDGCCDGCFEVENGI